MSIPDSSASVHKVEKQGPPGDVIPYSESGAMRRSSSANVYENGAPCLPHRGRWWMPGIRKDDEFFHFVILCFSIGIILVCSYRYNNWTVSLGVGLMTFAALEITGIYFGLVYRIRNILQSLMPLIPAVKIPGLKKAN